MSDTTDATRADANRVSGPALRRLAVELVLGIGLAAIIMLVAWTSSSAIRFVYGGY